MRLVVCTVGGWHAPWGLPASLFLGKTWVSGGERTLYELSVAAAAAGVDVELRGDLHRSTLDELCRAAGAAPRVGLPPRLPTGEDVVVVPEGWPDPVSYGRVALSPARAVLMLLAPPGLFGWPFTDGWSPPDPLTVDPAAVGRPEHYRGMKGLGFELWTNSRRIAEEAGAADVGCRFIGCGSPGLPSPPPKRVDVAVIGHNRWAPLARAILDDLDVSHTIIPEVRHPTMLYLLGEARILLWPSRIEGSSRIQREARAMGTVPVALRSNRYAEGLTEEEGAILVDDVRDMAEAARSLLADGEALRALSERATKAAREQTDWGAFAERVGEAIAAPAPDDPLRPARAGFGAAVAALAEGLVQDGERRLALAEAGFTAFRERRSVRAAARASDRLTRTLHRR